MNLSRASLQDAIIASPTIPGLKSGAFILDAFSIVSKFTFTDRPDNDAESIILNRPGF